MAILRDLKVANLSISKNSEFKGLKSGNCKES